MASNKLNLLVEFAGIDKLSGSIRNIMGTSSKGSESIRAMSREVKLMERDLARVHKQMARGGGGAGLIMAERELSEAIARTNREIAEQERRLGRIEAVRSRAGRVAGLAGRAGAAATVSMSVPLIAFGQHAFRAAMDAEELQSKFDLTFGKNAASMNSWAASSAASLNRTEVELKNAASTFGLFFNQADPAKSAAMSQQFATLAQDLASFHNTDAGDAMEKLRAGLSGESEPLRAFGVFLNDAAIQAKALELGLKPVNGKLTDQQKIMARAAFIMDATKNAQGDVIRTSDSTANKLRAAETAWANLSLTIGRDLIPAITPAISTIGDLLKSFAGLSPEARKWILIMGGAAVVLGPLLVGIAGIASAIGVIAPLFAGVALATALPFIAAGAAIAALVAVIVYNWDSIKAAFSAGISWIRTTFAGLPAAFRSFGAMMLRGLLIGLNPIAFARHLISLAGRGVAAFKEKLGIRSPSRLFAEMGQHINAGLGIGIERGEGRPVRAVGRMAGAVAGAGALALSPAAARSGAAPAPAGKIEIHVHQAAGESGEELAQRVAELVQRGEKSRSRRSYEDDF